MPFTVEIPDKEFVTVEQLLNDPDMYDNTSVWVKGFVSNLIENKADVYYSTFDLSTYEMDNVADNVSVYFPQGWLTTKGANEGSYAVIHGVFNADEVEIESHGVKLWQGDVVAEDTPTCWGLVKQWRTSVYVVMGFTRSWGSATYTTENKKDIHEGFLRAALTRFSYVNLDVEDLGAMTVAVCASLHVDSALPGEYFNYYPILERFTDILGTWGACRSSQALRDPDVDMEPTQDGVVEWNGVYYNSRNPYFMSPVGTVSEPLLRGDRVPQGHNVRFRIRVFRNDVTEVSLWVWSRYLEGYEIHEMSKVAFEDFYEVWEYTLSAPPSNTPAEYWYYFWVRDSWSIDVYADDDFRHGGVGKMYEASSSANNFKYLLAISDVVDSFAFVAHYKFYSGKAYLIQYPEGDFRVELHASVPGVELVPTWSTSSYIGYITQWECVYPGLKWDNVELSVSRNDPSRSGAEHVWINDDKIYLEDQNEDWISAPVGEYLLWLTIHPHHTIFGSYNGNIKFSMIVESQSIPLAGWGGEVPIYIQYYSGGDPWEDVLYLEREG